jgi:hypothetical protein
VRNTLNGSVHVHRIARQTQDDATVFCSKPSACIQAMLSLGEVRWHFFSKQSTMLDSMQHSLPGHEMRESQLLFSFVQQRETQSEFEFPAPRVEASGVSEWVMRDARGSGQGGTQNTPDNPQQSAGSSHKKKGSKKRKGKR